MKNKIYKIIMTLTVIIALLIGQTYAYTEEIKIATKTNTVEDPIAKNNDLKSLKVGNYELYPEFDKNITTYYCIIDSSVKSIEVEATADNEEDATVKITGNSSLTKDENTINVVVTSKSGSKKTYSIITKKRKNTELALESLSIEGTTSEIQLSENKFQYDVEIETKEIAPLNIVAKANDEDATVEILGNDENLLEGDNTITIILKKGQDSIIYQINTKIKLLKETQVLKYEENENFITNFAKDVSKKVSDFFSDEKRTLIFLCAVALILVMLIIIFIIRIIRRNKIARNKENIKKRAQ